MPGTPVRSAPASRPAAVAVAAIAVTGHVLVGGLIVVSGLVMPPWAVGSMGVLWAIGVVALARWRRRPARMVAVPVGIFGVWMALAVIGDLWLGWTA